MSETLSAQITVAATPTQLVPATPASQTVVLKNRHATAAFFVGGPGVTASTGQEVKAGEDWSQGAVELPSETELYGVTASGTSRADVLRIVAD